MGIDVNLKKGSTNVNIAGVLTPWQLKTGVSVQLEIGDAFIANGGPGLQTFTLPPTVASGGEGDGIAIKGSDIALYEIKQNGGQNILGTGDWTTQNGANGKLVSTDSKCTIVLISINETRSEWSATTIEGFFDLDGTGQLINDDGFVNGAGAASITNSSIFYKRRVENTFNVDQISAIPGIVNGAYVGAVYYRKRGLIFLIPRNATNVGIIDIVNKTIDTTTIPVPAGAQKWGGATIAWNGKAYLWPRSFGAIGILDMENLTIDLTTMAGSFNSYYAGFLAPNNGMLYAPPFGSFGGTLKINPFNETFSTFGVYPGFAQKCQGVVLSSFNGMGYAVPRTQADYVAIINPFNDTVDTTTIAGLAGTNKWNFGCEGSDLLLYFGSQANTATLIVDPSTNTVDNTTITGFTLHNGGAVTASNDKIYMGPKQSRDNVLIIDVPTQTADDVTISGLSGSDISNGMIFTDMGEVYTVPFGEDYSVIIQTGLPKISVDWCVSAYDNKL